MAEQWQDDVRLLVKEAREYLQRALSAPPRRAGELQHSAIVALMTAVEIHNDNFRFKVTHNGTQVSE